MGVELPPLHWYDKVYSWLVAIITAGPFVLKIGRFVIAKLIAKLKGESMLEGNEVDSKFDNGAGEFIVDADDKGGLKISLAYNKAVEGYGTAGVAVSLQTNILDVAAKVAAQTNTTLDDKAIAGLKEILGIA